MWYYLCFFFKQKTAYDMRISDWSSDVCSSDLLGRMDTTKLLLESIAIRKCVETGYNRMAVKLAPHILYTRHDELFIDAVTIEREGKPPREIKKIGRASCRERVCQYV